MARGKKTGGRQVGSKNKRTKALEEAAQNAASYIAKALGADAFEGDAHAFLMTVYKNTSLPNDIRIYAAKAAVRFEKPALTAVDSKSEVLHRFVARVPDKARNTETWQQQHAPPILHQ